MGKSFSATIDAVCENQHDMKELIQNWADLLSPTVKDVQFTMFDSTVYTIPNFAKITQLYGNPYETPQYPTDGTIVKRSSTGILKASGVETKSLLEWNNSTNLLSSILTPTELNLYSNGSSVTKLNRDELFMSNSVGAIGRVSPYGLKERGRSYYAGTWNDIKSQISAKFFNDSGSVSTTGVNSYTKVGNTALLSLRLLYNADNTSNLIQVTIPSIISIANFPVQIILVGTSPYVLKVSASSTTIIDITCLSGNFGVGTGIEIAGVLIYDCLI